MKSKIRIPARFCGLFVSTVFCAAPVLADAPSPEATAATAHPQSVPAPLSEGSQMNAALAAMSASELASRLHTASLRDIQMAELAAQHSSNEDIKSLARETQEDHAMIDKKLQAVIAQMQLQLAEPSPANEEDRLNMKTEREALAQLRTLSGLAFDRAYLNAIIDVHPRTIQMASIGHGSLPPSPLRNLLEEIIPNLRSHLDRAMNIQKSLPREP